MAMCDEASRPETGHTAAAVPAARACKVGAMTRRGLLLLM